MENERLLLYTYGELAATEAVEIERHLAGCAVCRAALQEVKAVRDAAGSLRAEPAPAAVSRVREAARAGIAPRPGLIERLQAGVSRPRLGFAAAAATTALAVFFAWHYWTAQQARPEDFSSDGLAQLAAEVEGWNAPPLAEAMQEGDASPWAGIEEEMDEWDDESEGPAEWWSAAENATGLEAIEQGLDELDSSVRYL